MWPGGGNNAKRDCRHHALPTSQRGEQGLHLDEDGAPLVLFGHFLEDGRHHAAGSAALAVEVGDLDTHHGMFGVSAIIS